MLLRSKIIIEIVFISGPRAFLNDSVRPGSHCGHSCFDKLKFCQNPVVSCQAECDQHLRSLKAPLSCLGAEHLVDIFTFFFFVINTSITCAPCKRGLLSKVRTMNATFLGMKDRVWARLFLLAKPRSHSFICMRLARSVTLRISLVFLHSCLAGINRAQRIQHCANSLSARKYGINVKLLLLS